MKKFAYMLAALSLCAFTFAGCSDDNDNSGAEKAKAGESCAEMECDGDLVCNDAKICEEKADAPAKAKKGESCADAECDADLVCNDESKICEEKADAPAKAKKGESCADAECDADLVCNDESKICEEKADAPAKAKKGESCADAECDADLVCNDESKICEEKADAPADEIKCDDLSNVKEAVEALVKVDLSDCKAFNAANADLATAFLLDKVISMEDSSDAVAAKVKKVLSECGAGWGIDEAKGEAIAAASVACAEDAGDK